MGKILWLTTVFLVILPARTWTQSVDEVDILSSLDTIGSDSARIDYLMDRSWSFARRDPELSLRLVDKMQKEIDRSGSAYRQDVVFYYRGVFYKNLSRYGESEEAFEEYRDFHAQLGNKPHLALVNMAMANLFSDQGLWARSMDAVTASLRLYEELTDTIGQVRASSKLGFILTQLDRTEDALAYHRNALHLATAIADRPEMAIAHSNIGLSYEKESQWDSAYTHYYEAYEIDQELEDDWGLVYDNTQLGRVLLKMNRYDDALPYAHAAHQKATALKAPNLIAFSQLLLGSVRIRQGASRAGIELIEGVLNDNNLSQSQEDESEAHEALYLAYKDLGRIDQAFVHLEQHHRLEDSLLNKNITNQINGLEIKYQTDKKEQEIALLNTENELASTRLQAARTQSLGLWIGLALFSLLLFAIYRLYIKTRKQKEIVTRSLDEKNILLQEIHHRVKNNLQFVSSLLRLQSHHVTDRQAITALKEGQNRVKSMALIHQNLYQEDNLTGVDVKDYFEKLTSGLFDSYNIDPERISLKMDIEDVNLDVDTVIPLGLIVNELISNALKHAFHDQETGVVTVALKEVDQELHLSVSDDGVGFGQQESNLISQSFGHQLIEAFKSQLNAQLDIDGEEGTSVRLRIKEYQKVA